MANSRKNLRLIDQYQGLASRYLAGSVENRITSLTAKQELQKNVYMAVATQATTENWNEGMRYAARAVIREMFDGNRVTMELVLTGANQRFPGLINDIGDTFDRIVGASHDLASRLNLPGLHRHRLQDA